MAEMLPIETEEQSIERLENQIREFEHGPSPSKAIEATQRPGVFLYRMYRAWNSLGKGQGIAGHTFKVLREELGEKEPKIKNLQPKIYGKSSVNQSDAKRLIDFMLSSWKPVENGHNEWNVDYIDLPVENDEEDSQEKRKERIELIRDNLLKTLFHNNKSIKIEEPIGVSPEVFCEDRGRSSSALLLPSTVETIVSLSPVQAFTSMPSLVSRFFEAAVDVKQDTRPLPFWIWILKLERIRDNSEFHESFYALAVHAMALSEWYFRLCRRRGAEKEEANELWQIISRHCAFVIQGLPEWSIKKPSSEESAFNGSDINEDLKDLGDNFFLPNDLPRNFRDHKHVKTHPDYHYGLTVSIEPNEETGAEDVRYWLFPERPERPKNEHGPTDQSGFPVFGTESSPGEDYDLAYSSIHKATKYFLSYEDTQDNRIRYETLCSMGWRFLKIDELQRALLINESLEG